MSSPEDVKGPIIIWEDYGCEGWAPRSYPTLMDAVKDGRITRNCAVTMLVDISKHIIEPNAPALPEPPPASQRQNL